MSRLTSKHFIGQILICTICLIAFDRTSAFAQTLSEDYISKHWSVDDGLPVNEIVSIAQTGDGYIWLATFDGLVRFDGDQFTVFNTGNTPEFPTNRFIELKVDHHDNLWIVTETVGNSETLISYHGGQFKFFDPEQGIKGNLSLKLDPYENILIGSDNGAFYYDGKSLNSFGDELHSISVRDITVDVDSAFWFATNHGVFRLSDNEWTKFTEQDGLDSKNAYTAYMDSQEKVWIGTDAGVNILEQNRITSLDISWPRNADQSIDIRENPNNPGQFFLINDHHFVYTFKEGKTFPYPSTGLQGEYLVDVQIDRLGVIWAQMYDQLFQNEELVYTANATINGMLKDDIGNIWVAQSDGLTQLKPKVIKSYTDNISNVYTLTESPVGEVWATQGYRNTFQLKSGTFNDVNAELGIPSPRPSYSIFFSEQNQVLIGTVHGVFQWDRKNPVTLLQTTATSGQDLPRMHDIKAITEDFQGNMWYGGANGIYRQDEEDSWQYFGKIDDNDILGVRLIYQTRDSTLWFGTNGNGLLYLKDGELNSIKKKGGLSGNIIRSMYEDAEGILWIGTEGWGLNRIERTSLGLEGAKITSYGKRNGLFDNVIHQILEDDHGRLWMNSNRGIFWVNRTELNAFATEEVSSIYSFFYSEQDGLPGREGNGGVQPAGFKSQTGELWFPMVGGVVSIDPDQVKTAPLNVFIEQINTTDSTWHVGDLQSKVFSVGLRALQINYAALDFSTNPNNIRYRYKLEGVDENWIEAGNTKEAVYNRLPPGTYTFRVTANNGGGWLLNETTLLLTFPHFFYETNWFYGIVALLLALIIYGGVNWRIRILKQQGKALEDEVALRTHDLIREKEATERQKEIATEALQTVEKQAAVLRELDQAKSRFFTNISHEFRTPLTLIIGPLEQQVQKLRSGIAGDEEDMELALRNSKRLLRLVNQILEVAKLESGQTRLQARLVDIRTVIEPIVDAFRSLAERNSTHFHAELPAEPVMVYIDTDLMEKAIINLLSNAFKFTPENGSISVSVSMEMESIGISIKDNGPGISKEEQEHIFERFYQVNESTTSMQAGTGIGLSLVHELVALHKGSIELISEPRLGSEFLVKLKTGKAHLSNDQYTDEVDTESMLSFNTELNDTPEHANAQSVSTDQNSDQPTLLVVEDNADIRTYVRKHLSTEYRVIEAENGQEGFQIVKAELPDLVISDVMMPISDGYELCRNIKQHPDLDFIPVILLTAKAEKSMKIEGLELGADDYVVKPFEVDELRARIKNLINSREKLKGILANTDITATTPDRMGWVDTPFANRVRAIIEQHLSDEDFSVVQLAEEVNIGRTTLYSRILELTGKTPSEMIKLTRLYQASQLLKEEAGNISEIAYATGFKSISHFSKTFKAEFGVVPTQYGKSHFEMNS
ncbi:two-component regulator propeller domain-containing protein [Roseivirga sp. E12]|uniref:hybrid sensor histidine kinase/response regulator transcription factor n=1 Tax=Roseivirga sp. E12 TaxID=2819237 RepID=UPI001ABC7816|nr:two-component regulator propeller domain-containing protein [Roseivirga sp. E12]MBO3699097.1 response regulator [Roseivirga sp. E12]